jgi:hypothetical protein
MTVTTDYTLHWFAAWRTWMPAVALVDNPPERYRIAITSAPTQNADNWFAYPFMGRRLQNEVVYVPISGDGHLRHFGSEQENADLLHTADFWAWNLRLRRAGVTHVMSFSPPGMESAWMAAHPESFERLAGRVDDWSLYLVRQAHGS